MSSASTARLLDEAQGVGAMTWVIAIMLFLTLLAAAMGVATGKAADALGRSLAGRVTVQLVGGDPVRRDQQATRIVARLRATPGVTQATLVDRSALAGLLKPFLGDSGSDPELPLPVMIDADLNDAGASGLARVEHVARSMAPDARIDAHERWMAPIASVLSITTWLGAALVLLMASATAAVVVLSARAGLEAHRATIEVMHMLGATDVQVARLFQRRIARDAAVGGAIGAGAAVATILLVGSRLSGVGSELIGNASLGIGGWLLVAALPVAFVIVAMIAARFAVTHALGRML